MGLFDRLLGKPTTAANNPAEPPAAPVPVGEPIPAAEAETAYEVPTGTAGKVMPRLAEARAKLEAKDMPAALAIYEQVLSEAGERADVLVTISGDLGVTGHLQEITELVAPRYDADKHGPAAGLNVLQAYLALRNVHAAQHLLDILFALNRPELEDRLHGFSNAIADIMALGGDPDDLGPASNDTGEPTTEPPKVNLVSISKPIWFYGLESAGNILPPKGEKLRRVAFAQFALPGLENITELAGRPEEEMGRLSRALPLWLAETFYFSPHYAPIAAIGVMGQQSEPGHYALFPAEWSTDNLRQLVDSAGAGLDYIFTGALKQHDGDYEVILRVWEVRKFRERKQFTARWTPATADQELAKFNQQVCQFMEWSADASALTYRPPTAPRNWLETLGASLTLFLADKKLLAADQIPDLTPVFAAAGSQGMHNEVASLALLTLGARARGLELMVPPLSDLAETDLVKAAKAALGS